MDFYNSLFRKNIKSTKGFERNFQKWREIHDLDKIKYALEVASTDRFWKDKMTLTILFRQKNPNGEDVDYIEELSAKSPTQATSGDIAII